MYLAKPCAPKLADVPMEDLRTAWEAENPEAAKACSGCGIKVPGGYAAMAKHMETCQTSKLLKEQIDIEKQIKELTTRLAELKRKTAASPIQSGINSGPQCGTNNQMVSQIGSGNTVSTTNSNNTTIQIYNFNTPDLSYLPNNFLLWCYDSYPGSMPTLIDSIYFNRAHPENRSVRKKNMKKYKVVCSENGKWIIGDLINTIDTMRNTCTCAIARSVMDLPTYSTHHMHALKLAPILSTIYSVRLNIVKHIKRRLENEEEVDVDLSRKPHVPLT